ncbi:MAG: hydrogenase maturation protease [Anaerolineae bacterium]
MADQQHNNQEHPFLGAPEARILVIGYGNTLRGDDGLGVVAVERLQVMHSAPQITFVACHQLSPELSLQLSEADYCLLLDAGHGEPAGAISIREIKPDLTRTDTLHHHMPPEALLAYTGALFGSAPRTWLCTINAASFDFQEALSPAVERALPALLKQIVALIDRLRLEQS